MGTIRVRLTVWYATLFLVASIVLLVLLNVLVERAIPTTDPAWVQRVADRPGAAPFRGELEALGIVRPRGDGLGGPLSGPGMRPSGPDQGPIPPLRGSGGDMSIDAILEFVEEGRIEARDQALDTLLVQSSLALGVLLVISVGAGWLVAGRMLRPVAEIAATVRRIDAERLDGRVALDGPRDELKELADQFDAMLDRLDAAFRAQREFVANASHELRTPLAIMRAELDVTFGDPDADVESLRASADTIRRAIARSEALISALLTLERADAPRQVTRAIDLAEVVGQVLSRHEAAADGRGIEIRRDLAPSPIEGDPVLIERLVENLVTNAIAYNASSDDGGAGGARWISVATQVTAEADGGAGVQLVVSNSSAPIEDEVLAGLFERFRRTDDSRARETGGHGLGLAIVRAVARHHGGDASARSIEGPAGPGVEFTVRLPGVA